MFRTEKGKPTSALRWLRRNWQFAALTGWTALWFVLLAPGKNRYPAGGGIAWRPFLVQGSRGLFTGVFRCFAARQSVPGGLHLYANCPSLQIGPLAFVMAEPIRYLGGHSGLVAAELVLSAMGLTVLAVLRRIAVTARPELAGSRDLGWAFLAGGAIFVIGWQELAVAYAHLDDGLVLIAIVLATWAAVRGRPVLTGLAFGLAVDAKPWALAFLPVLLLSAGLAAWQAPNLAARPVRASIRPCLAAAATAALVTLAGWLPFFLAAPRTSLAFHYKIANIADSSLRVLGVASAQTPPWDRPAQLAIGCLLGGLAIWRGRWPAVILLGVGARIALDPATHSYYTAGVLAGALLWDLLGARRPWPAWTLLSYAALDLVPLVSHDATARGAVRLGLVLAFTSYILLGPARWFWQPAPAPAE
jgi:hypothetical protein